MICPGCGCDSFQEAYSNNNVLRYKNFRCVAGCGSMMGIINKGYITSHAKAKYLNWLRVQGENFLFKKPYFAEFVKQYNREVNNGN